LSFNLNILECKYEMDSLNEQLKDSFNLSILEYKYIKLHTI